MAGVDLNGNFVVEGIKPDRSFSKEEFLDWVHKCLDKWGVDWQNRNIVIGTHVSRMELQHITPLPKIKKYGDKNWEVWLDSKTRVFDTYKLFGVALAKLTEGAPIKKVSLEGFHGKPERHWRPNPDFLFAESEEKFWEYALVDAKALLWSLLHMRTFVWDRWHLDLLRSHSLAGLACRILESHITEPLEPSLREKYLGKDGRSHTRVIFNPELTDARRTALRAYQGGRREAYVMGLFPGPVYCYDFAKQYTVATLSIPLPSRSTEIKRMKSLADINKMVGWARVQFRFPLGVNPCIGVKEPRFPKLVFPREGEAYAGVFTLRRAIEKGAKIKFISGWGFVPTEKETNHLIHKLFRELLSLGKEHAGHFEEKFAKNIANMLVGQFIGKFDVEGYDSDPESMIEDKLSEGWRPKPKQVMGSFAPMHASLILDQARALEDRLIDLCENPVYGHTDSIYSRTPMKPDDEFIKRIRDLGGDVILKMTGSYGWVLRAAVGYFPNTDPSKEGEAPHHAFHSRREDFVASVEFMLAHPEFVPPSVVEEEYTSLREYERKGEPLASQKDRRTRPKYAWDYKRKLLGPPIESTPLLWTEHRETEPWQSLDELLRYVPYTSKKGKTNRTLAQQYIRLMGMRGRPSSLTVEDQKRILQLAMKGMRPRDIVKAIPNATKWSVHRLLRKSLSSPTRKNTISQRK